MKELDDVKLEIVSKAVEEGKLGVLNDAGFFETISQIERSRKLHTNNRIWLGRMLKLVFGKSCPNPNGVAIFQRPNQFKEIRKFSRENKQI